MLHCNQHRVHYILSPTTDLLQRKSNNFNQSSDIFQSIFIKKKKKNSLYNTAILIFYTLYGTHNNYLQLPKLYTTIPQNITEEVLINEALWELQTREVQTIMPNSNKT